MTKNVLKVTDATRKKYKHKPLDDFKPSDLGCKMFEDKVPDASKKTN